MLLSSSLPHRCPKCGSSFDELKEGGVTEVEHLLNCNNEQAHQKQKEKRQKMKEKKVSREVGATADADAAALASWSFLGSKDEQLYLLNNDQLRTQCKGKGVDISDFSGDKAELITKLVDSERSLVVRDGGKGGGRISMNTLPSLGTLQRFGEEELRAVLASHGVGDTKGKTKRQMLDMIENRVMSDGGEQKQQVLMLEGGEEEAVCGKKRKQEVIDIDDSSDEDEWEPED